MRCENAHGAAAHLWLPIEQQQHPSHECGPAGQAAVRGLVAAEIARRKRIRQSGRLMKAQAKPFARDGVNTSGRIADQRHVVAIDSLETASERDGPLFSVGLCRRKMLSQLRKLRSN